MLQDEPEIPGYEVEKRLGKGGMATVFLAMQRPINRAVALKVMSNQLGEDSVWAKRFIQEAQVIAQLTHPNVVPVYDVGTHDGKFYISMEYLPGGSLKGRMKNGITIPEALKIVIGIAAGLDFAGEKGFVHRDIKPDNIMFREDGAPVILDFGIVKQMDDGPNKMTQTGVIVGTTSYMSPEQAQGRELDQRSDIYALGILFFELLTGKPPFKGETDVATLLQHINQAIPRLPEELSVFQPIIDKALAKDPFHRYARARELIDHVGELEPRIKAALNKLRATEPTDDATIVKTLDKQDDDATQAMAPGESVTAATAPVTGEITTEEELTQVLSSAKATIRDFSVESRNKKARRTKNLIIGMSMVAVLAMSYVGYHQLYVVPQERAAAEEKIRAAELKARKKIEELLAQAKEARQGLIPNQLDRVDALIEIYRQVLKLEPENKEAQFVLEKYGLRYVDMAKSAVERRDFNKAATYRDYAEQLVPSSPELPGLRSSIKALRAEQIDRELVKEEVENLVGIARADYIKSGGFSESAYTKLKQALRLDPENQEASNLVDEMLNKLYVKTQKDISRGKLSRARANLSTLEKYYDDPEQLVILSEALDNTSSKVAKKQRVSKLMVSADRLLREKRTISVNDQLRETYLSILNIDSKHSEASRGLIDTGDFDATVARQAIDDRDFTRAFKQIEIIERYVPNYSGIKSLRDEVKGTQEAIRKADVLLADAQAIIQKDEDVEKKRQSLRVAFNKIEEAKALDSANPLISQSMSQLESEYLVTIKGLIAKQNNSLVNAYFDDASDKRWPSDRILQLQIAQQSSTKKSKPKRVITGGF